MTRYVYIVADYGSGIARTINNMVVRAQDLVTYVGDQINLRIFVKCQRTAGVYEAVNIGRNTVIEFAVKKKTAYVSGNYLALAKPSEINRLADWPEVSRQDGRISLLVRFDGKDVLDLFENDTPTQECEADLSFTDPGQRPTTIRIPLTIANQVLRETIAEPETYRRTLATQSFVDAAVRAISKPPRGRYAMKDGNLYLRDRALNKLVPVELDNGALVRVEGEL